MNDALVNFLNSVTKTCEDFTEGTPSGTYPADFIGKGLNISEAQEMAHICKRNLSKNYGIGQK